MASLLDGPQHGVAYLGGVAHHPVSERLYRIEGNPGRTSALVKWIVATAIGIAAVIIASLAVG